MEDPYYIRFEAFSLDRLIEQFKSEDVLPGRQILREEVDERFEILSSMGMHNLADLIAALSTKRKLEQFSQQSGLPVEYLVILRREVRSYIPKPVYLAEIPGVDPQDAQRLASTGITHSKHFFERGQTVDQRKQLSRASGISMQNLLEFARLSDLARVRGLGPTFTRLIYEAGADSIESLSRWDPEELFQVVHTVNRERHITRAVPPLKDFKQYVEIAGDLPKVIEYD